MTLLKDLRDGKDPIDSYIRDHLPQRGAFGDGPGMIINDFRAELTKLAGQYELRLLQSQRGLLGPVLEGEPEVIEAPLGELTSESTINAALSYYAEFPEIREKLAPRLARRLKERNKELGKKMGGGGVACGPQAEDPVVNALGSLSVMELVLTRPAALRQPDIKAFLTAVYPKVFEAS